MRAGLLQAAVGEMTNFATNLAAPADEGLAGGLAEGLSTEGLITVKTSLADWIIQGGFMMIPILLCAILVLAIIIERTFSLRRVRRESQIFTEKITRIVRANKLMEAKVVCENSRGPLPAIVKAALLARAQSAEESRLAVEEAAERAVRPLERYLPALGTIATVSPLLGLLGTVIGMIKSSNFLATAGAANPIGLIGGISEALITTAAGLFVAIPAVVCHSWFTNKVNTIMLDMEAQTNDIIDLLARVKTPAKRQRLSVRKNDGESARQ